MHVRRLILSLILILVSATAFAQQTGNIRGRVTATDGSALPGVTVEARSNALPQPRVTTTDAAGSYQLPALQPGAYTLTFNLSGMQTMTRRTEVLLQQDAFVDVKLGVAGVSENITVTAESTLVNRESTAIQSTLSTQEIQALPVAQDYRDLVKFATGVQYTQENVRGPSAGGSGQDNVYQFDGVNVNLPLFGTLASEAAANDIAQVSVVKGGAKAIDFNRAGGFSIDSVSKSGTNKWMGQLGYQVLRHGFTSAVKTGSPNVTYQEDRSWGTANIGGPIVRDRLFFFGSYYRPTRNRDNQSNFYGELPKYASTRNEGFAKLTFTPTSSFLINGSYRSSKRSDKAADLIGTSATAPTAGSGADATLKIGILEGSWITSPRSYATAKFTNFANKTHGVPDVVANVNISTAIGTKLDLANLDKIGRLFVPTSIAGNTAFNNFIAPIVERYGYVNASGVRTGGGIVGYGNTFDRDDFFRTSGQVGYNMTLGTLISHDIHVGYQRYVDSENLQRTSNGFGDISVIGGRSFFTPAGGTRQAIYYQATFLQQSLGGAVVDRIHSEFGSQNFEVNDTIRWNNWSFNAGLLASNDKLYGQGLREDSSTLSGYVGAPGNKYLMYNIPFRKMLQPRLGATWAYNGQDTVYASVARYNPAASSLPRAASWDRNLAGRTLRAYFDQNGVLFGVDPVRSSSGKLFVKDLTPRTTNELLLGTAQQFTSRWSGRAYGRYRRTTHFWEDTNNTARIDFNPPAGIPREAYIPDLNARLAQIGSGSSYVIAELDGAFTKYYEGTLESDWRGDKTTLRGSYTWSHYYGNFDQDNSTNFNDANIFIGSSNIADDAGRQLWDNKYGNLRGDRRHILKLFGSYALPWNATAGAYGIYQSGQPYELLSYLPYKNLTTSTSDTDRNLEPAGSRRTPAHHQIDLNYTQNIAVFRGYNIQLAADVFNVYNKQTGYNFENRVGTLGFVKDLTNPPAGAIQTAYGLVNPVYARSFYAPRRFQLAVRLQF